MLQNCAREICAHIQIVVMFERNEKKGRRARLSTRLARNIIHKSSTVALQLRYPTMNDSLTIYLNKKKI